MSNQVLIVAAEVVARKPAEIARSLDCTPVIAGSADEALTLLDDHRFSLIAVSGNAAWQRLRDAAESKQPMARVLELPEPDSDDAVLRQMMIRYLDRPAAGERPIFTEERYRFLSGMLESFTTTLDLREVLRRIVNVTREEFNADRAWLLHPVSDQSEYAKVSFFATAPGYEGSLDEKGPVSLHRSRALINRAMESARPVVVFEGDDELNPELARRHHVRSEILQILRPPQDEPGAF